MRGSPLWSMSGALAVAVRGCWRCAPVLAVRQRVRDRPARRVLGMALAAVLLLPPSLSAQAADIGALRFQPGKHRSHFSPVLRMPAGTILAQRDVFQRQFGAQAARLDKCHHQSLRLR